MNSLRSQLMFGSLIVLVALSSEPGAAAAPSETLRWFGELSDPALPSVDWEADGSKRIVSHRGGQGGGMIEFITPDGDWEDEDAIVRDQNGKVIFDLRSTAWTKMPVIHVGDLGVEEVRHVYWLREDLDGDGVVDEITPGATSKTGPNGDVRHLVTIRIARVPDNDPSVINRGKYYVTPLGNSKFSIAAGLFQK